VAATNSGASWAEYAFANASRLYADGNRSMVWSGPAAAVVLQYIYALLLPKKLVPTSSADCRKTG
jgi:hypothetical protein